MELTAFRDAVYAWFREHGRELPWRGIDDPYRILVSEVMLQQTQVERVAVKYREFVEAIPDFDSLHRAPLHEVVRVWQGMGYNRRALALKKIAAIVMEEHGGELPADVEALERLPGIGRATAASIGAFAFRLPTVFIETNIRRVFLHFFFPGQEGVGDGELLPLVESALDTAQPHVWYSALMDYGAWLRKEAGNANRRSSAYRRQAPFEGSNRQLRGKILRALLAQPGLPCGEIARAVEDADGRVSACLRQLQQELLVRETHGGYAIE